jgi:hypothetical protein
MWSRKSFPAGHFSKQFSAQKRNLPRNVFVCAPLLAWTRIWTRHKSAKSLFCRRRSHHARILVVCKSSQRRCVEKLIFVRRSSSTRRHIYSKEQMSIRVRITYIMKTFSSSAIEAKEHQLEEIHCSNLLSSSAHHLCMYFIPRTPRWYIIKLDIATCAPEMHVNRCNYWINNKYWASESRCVINRAQWEETAIYAQTFNERVSWTLSCDTLL